MTRNMECYKLLALEQARVLCYKLDSDSMDKFVTRKLRGDADLHTSSECDFDRAMQPPEKVGTTSSSNSRSYEHW